MFGLKREEKKCMIVTCADSVRNLRIRPCGVVLRSGENEVTDPNVIKFLIRWPQPQAIFDLREAIRMGWVTPEEVQHLQNGGELTLPDPTSPGVPVKPDFNIWTPPECYEYADKHCIPLNSQWTLDKIREEISAWWDARSLEPEENQPSTE